MCHNNYRFNKSIKDEGETMAKEKHLPKSVTEAKLLSREAENTLYGLILLLVSLIGILNNGFVGNFLTYISAYVFGVFYFLPFLIGMAMGFYLILMKKSYLLKVNVVFLGVILIFIASLIGSSLSPTPDSFATLFSNYHANISNAVMEDTIFKLRLESIGTLGGGILGNFLATLLCSTISKIGAYIIVVLLMAVGLYLTFAKLIIKIVKSIKESKKKRKAKLIERLEEEQKEKEEKEKLKEKEKLEEEEFKSKAMRVMPSMVEDDTNVINNSSFSPKRVGVDDLVENDPVSLIKPKNFEEPTPINEMFADDIEENDEINPVVKNKIDDGFKEKNHYEEMAKIKSSPTRPTIENIVNSETSKTITRPEITKEKYVYPSLDLLNDAHNKSMREHNAQVAEERREIINQTFRDFNIGASVDTYTVGPTVTRFDIRTSSTTSVNSVQKVIDDMALRLGGVFPRFAKVVPGRTTSGLEIANDKVDMVTLKEVLTAIKDRHDKPLLIPFGKDISGNVICESMTKFPHMLVAGASGSGKSVFLQSFMLSLLIRHTPDEVKFLIIDPKRVEFNYYRDIPHLLCPIISEPLEAKVALNKMLKEMDNRYCMLEQECFTDIKQYNEAMLEEGKETIPYIVIIIDEYNDLKNAVNDIELPIIRLAQKARAAGIHICIATQRPSTDVVTGTLKANLPTKVALMVSNTVDSITILGQSGAERLLGNGDLLLDCAPLIRGGGFIRLQSSYVDRKEIIKIVSFLKEHYQVNYNPDFLDLKDRSAMGPTFIGGENAVGEDERYSNLKSIVMARDYISISAIMEICHSNFNTAKGFYLKLQEEGIIEKVVGSTNSKGAKVICKVDDTTNDEDSEE